MVYVPINIEVKQAGEVDIVHVQTSGIDQVVLVDNMTPEAQYRALNELSIKSFNPANRGTRINAKHVDNFKKAWGIK